ncbi:MAG: hypothetical protein KGZ81_07155 [Flavobacteriales bacterium]|nr:hypothetical protein [Flavobacteriales bacterium]
MGKITGLPEDTSPSTDDFTVTVDITTGVTKKLKWLNLAGLFQSLVLPFVYPIGSLYLTVDSENPNDTFGFGTWEAFAEGRAIVGVAAAGTFAGVETEVGAETVTLTTAQIPAHNHTGTTSTDGSHSHGLTQDAVTTSPSGNQRTYLSGGSGQQLEWGDLAISSAGSHNHTFTTANSGGGGSHTNIQPSITTYIWKRTA